MTIAPDFREFAACLNAYEVRYLIVEGYAVAFHGHPRYTKDLDVWIERTSENVRRLLQALEDFGFGSVGLEETDFLEPEQVVQLGYPPLRIDLLTSVTGVAFEECYDECEALDVEGVHLSFIGLEGLRANKRASGRHQDLADLENLE
jgi:predicted nucleotidyltransferase